ncbi:Gfo/Idh/MocA family oxidoreductase [Streptosporangium sp. LJ11]|uniref:Gfo/Idh/MocA family protein n=1 Tax=Streptosporangium sp. LJ11 TaxID=3436927 RepID=UPI003F7AE803
MPHHQGPAGRRYAFVGTGSRARMYLEALLGPYADVGYPVAFCDTNEVRMAYYDRLVAEARPDLRISHHPADRFGRMLTRERPDVVVVTSPDATHADYISQALRHGADVVVEKPLTVDVAGLRQIQDALAASTAQLTVTFNYRYSPRNTLVRRLLADGAIGEVTSVAFEWCLDTVHGADYFRRWHRDKAVSGGLLVHKATHHFDLVNWWLADTPAVVFARGGLRFYGADNARERGLGPRPERSRDAVGSADPFALDILADDRLRRLYYDGEHLDGYTRDRDVFSEGITIEDNLNVVVGYRRGASMSYTLHAHSPWEGYRVAINGTEGRIELDVVERAHVEPDTAGATIGAATAPRAVSRTAEAVADPGAAEDDHRDGREQPRTRGARLLLQRHWERAMLVPIPTARGGHGGGDAMLLDDVFRTPAGDPLHRQAGFADGAASVMVGIAGNESLRTAQAVCLDDLGLSPAPAADRR